MVETANNIWADGPSSMPTEPRKFLIREWGTRVESAVPAGTPVLNSLAVGKADGTTAVQTRDAAKKALSLFGFDDGKMMFAGLRPDRLSANVIRLQPGQCADGALRPTDVMYLPATYDIDITTVGLQGLDVGSPVAGTGYFIYLLKNPTTGAVGAVISKEISTSLVTKPSGYTLIRKLPWGFIWSDGTTGGGNSAGIPLFHLCHWPHPETVYTDAAVDAPWAVVTAGVATNFTAGEFDVSKFVPDNSRMIMLCAVLTGTTAGDAYARSTGSGGSGKLIGSISASGQKSISRFKMRPSSLMKINYRVTVATCNLSIYAEGYDQTEVS